MIASSTNICCAGGKSMDAHSYLKSFSIIHRFRIMFHIKLRKNSKRPAA